MFDFIKNIAPEDAIAGVHFALRRISYRNPVATATSVRPTEAEPATPDERIGLKILNEIVEKEHSPIESLTETKAQKYKQNLVDIADKLSEKDTVQDDEATKVLEEWKKIPLVDTAIRPLGMVETAILATYLIVVTLALLLLLFVVWPRWDVTQQYWSQWLNIPNVYIALDLETRLILIAAAAGALGSLLNALNSLVTFIGNRTLVSSWIMWYVTQPLTGMIVAIIFYFVLRSTTLFGSPPQTIREFYLIASVSTLVGLFSDQVTRKLRDIMDTLFGSRSSLGRKQLSPNLLIASINPTTGTAEGGTVITIKGRFTGSTQVFFGGVAATSVKAIDATTLMVTTPPHEEGPVDLKVVNDDGQTVTQPSAFHYAPVSIALTALPQKDDLP